MNSVIKSVMFCYLSAYQNVTKLVIQTTIHIFETFSMSTLLVKALVVADAAVVAAEFVIRGATIC